MIQSASNGQTHFFAEDRNQESTSHIRQSRLNRRNFNALLDTYLELEVIISKKRVAPYDNYPTKFHQ